jgi:predicted nucleic acid-binding protein
LLSDDDRDRAVRLRADVQRFGGLIVAPPHFSAEASSAIYKRFQQGRLSLDDALSLVEESENLPVERMSPPTLSRRAFEIAAQFQLKWIYDAFYVALAEIVGCDLWTADEALHAAVRQVHTNVRLLSEYPVD